MPGKRAISNLRDKGVRGAYLGFLMIPKKRMDLIKSLKSHREAEEEGRIWSKKGRGKLEETNYEGIYNLLGHAQNKLKETGYVKIVELGMGEGRHVPELIRKLKKSSSRGVIYFHDLSLTKHLSNWTSGILELENEGIVHRHIGLFETKDLTSLKDSDVIYSSFGPLLHTFSHYEYVNKSAYNRPKFRAQLKLKLKNHLRIQLERVADLLAIDGEGLLTDNTAHGLLAFDRPESKDLYDIVTELNKKFDGKYKFVFRLRDSRSTAIIHIKRLK